jgi:hypothetical protein
MNHNISHALHEHVTVLTSWRNISSVVNESVGWAGLCIHKHDCIRRELNMRLAVFCIGDVHPVSFHLSLESREMRRYKMWHQVLNVIGGGGGLPVIM